jgi:hypothetical protein
MLIFIPQDLLRVIHKPQNGASGINELNPVYGVQGDHECVLHVQSTSQGYGLTSKCAYKLYLHIVFLHLLPKVRRLASP